MKPNIVTRQPVLTGGIGGGVLSALVVMLFSVLKSYGVNITPELETLVIAIAVAASPIITSLVARNYSTWWSVDNPLVNFEPGAAQVKPEAAE
jgi:hypothetical protein